MCPARGGEGLWVLVLHPLVARLPLPPTGPMVTPGPKSRTSSQGAGALVGKRYNSHFVECPLLLQELDEAGDLSMELHDHPAQKGQAGEGGPVTPAFRCAEATAAGQGRWAEGQRGGARAATPLQGPDSSSERWSSEVTGDSRENSDHTPFTEHGPDWDTGPGQPTTVRG